MTKQSKLKELLAKRQTPTLPRKEIVPVDLYGIETPESTQVDKTTSGQVHKPTSTLDHKTTSPQVVKTTSIQTVKPTSTQVVKYTTHLSPDMVKMIKKYAFEHDIKDYEVVQQAIGDYLRRAK